MAPVRFRHRVVAFAAWALFALASASAFQDPNDPPERRYGVAVVRADGIIVPFAEYDDGRWRDLWTGVERGSNPTVPITLDDVDEDWWGEGGPALHWWLWRRPGMKEPLNVKKPRTIYTPCSAEVGLETDLRHEGVLPPPHEAPFPKAGLATTAPIEFEPITALSPGSVDWTRVDKAVHRRFSRAEDRALSDMQWDHPTPSRLREHLRIDLQRVWHLQDSRFFYFEAMRRYPDLDPPEGQPPCELVTYVTGYFWEEPSEELRPVGVHALVSYCHLEQARYLWPLGAIREGDRRFWVVQSAGWTGEAYGIVEPDPTRPFVRSHVWHEAGRCEWRW